MKRLINPLLLFLVLSACKEKEVPVTKTIGSTSIKGVVTEINTDKPVANVDVYLWKYADQLGMIRELVDETISDANGNFDLDFSVDRNIYISANFEQTGYISYRHASMPNYSHDGKEHQHNIEMIPPAWVNITVRNKSGRKDFEVGSVSTQRDQNKWLTFDKNQDSASIMLKVFGNMPDSIAVSLRKYEGQNQITIERKVHMITVPGFMVKDTIIDF
jgi:hypothetical protein